VRHSLPFFVSEKENYCFIIIDILRKPNWFTLGDICAVTLTRFTGEKGADISSQNIFLDDSQTRYLTILGAELRKNSSAPVFRQ